MHAEEAGLVSWRLYGTHVHGRRGVRCGDTGYHGTDQRANGWCRCVEAVGTDYGRAIGSDVRGARWLQVHDTDGVGEDGRRWRGLIGHRCSTV